MCGVVLFNCQSTQCGHVFCYSYIAATLNDRKNVRCVVRNRQLKTFIFCVSSVPFDCQKSLFFEVIKCYESECIRILLLFI